MQPFIKTSSTLDCEKMRLLMLLAALNIIAIAGLPTMIPKEIDADRIINHPANSPDLNPMEDIWSALNSKVQKRPRLPPRRSERPFRNLEQPRLGSYSSFRGQYACSA